MSVAYLYFIDILSSEEERGEAMKKSLRELN